MSKQKTTINRNQIKSILIKGEKILYMLKPVKAKTLLNLVFRYLKTLGWTFFIFGAVVLGAFFTIEKGDQFDPEWIRYIIGLLAIITASVVTFIFIVILISELLDYRNRFYAVTNQRFIVQHGAVGVGHISLYIKSIFTFAVDVNLADKLLKKGTGSIGFGTGNTKLTGQKADFRFDDIPDVYENYQKFKEIIDTYPIKEVENKIQG